MATAEMRVQIWSGITLIFDRDVSVSDGDKNSIRPALIGFNQQMYSDAGLLLFAPPLGPPEEVIDVKIEYEIKYETIRVYYHEVTLESKRFIVIAGLRGMRVPVHEAVVKFINEYFVS